MCTVSYYQSPTAFIMTSSRDEHISRPAAIPPAEHPIENNWLVFPQDPQAGGTWFVADKKGNAAILFNGGFEKHKHQPPYARSRGLVLLDVFSKEDSLQTFQSSAFENIEPFSILFYKHKRLNRLTWTGTDKVQELLLVDTPQVFSSAPLYSSEFRNIRSNWYKDFIQSNSVVTPDGIFNFHNNAKLGDRENGLIIQRANGVRTRSITQAIIETSSTTMKHLDLVSGEHFELTFSHS